MKRLLVLFTLVLVSLMLLSSVVMADPAEVLKYDSYWGGFDGNGNFVFLVPVSVHKVITNDDTGTVNYAVKGTLPDGSALPDKAVHFETYHLGLICSFDAPYFKYTLTPNGDYKLQCRSQPFED